MVVFGYSLSQESNNIPFAAYAHRFIDGYVQAINAAASSELQVAYLTRRLGISHRRARALLQPVRLDGSALSF